MKKNVTSKIHNSQFKEMECKLCGGIVKKIDHDTVAVTCSVCVQEMVGPPIIKSNGNNELKRPRGWRLYNLFVDSVGNVFRKGVEFPKEKGKLPVTDIKKKSKEKPKKTTKREKNIKIDELLEELNKERRMTISGSASDQKKASRNIKKLQKELKKVRGY